jgi:hypothetical protein
LAGGRDRHGKCEAGEDQKGAGHRADR